MNKKQREEQKEDQKPDFPVVGIGASEGGVKALQEFLDHVPDNSGMAFVVILHDPEHSNSVDDLLKPHTGMEVVQVTRKTKIQSNHIYIVAPGKYLSVQGKHLVLSEKEGDNRPATADLFFRSLAQKCTKQAICIILTGTGTDGTVGIQAVKECGGIALAQDPGEAEYNGMPLSAISTNLVDFVLPLKDLGPKVVEYKEALSRLDRPLKPDNLSEKESEALHKIFTRLSSKTGHDFSHYKRSSVLRRIQRRMQVTHNTGIGEYLEYIQKKPGEVTELFEDLLISVTNFFRDPKAFKALEKNIIPQLFKDKEADEQVRVWVAGCATGEEAYSVAILLHEYASQLDNPPQIKIFATDISKKALQTARAGVYAETITADVSGERLRRYFDKEGSRYRVRKAIRELVLFSFHDLLRNPPFSNLDLVACRNLLIYFNSDLQSEVFNLLHYALRPEAFLFLGLSDSAIGAAELFAPVDKKQGLYKSRHFSKSRIELPSVPLGKNMYSGNPAYGRKSHEKKDSQFDKIHYTLRARLYAPATIIINDNNEVMHVSSGVNRYLRYAEGELSRNLLEMVTPELRRPLRGMLLKLNQVKGTQSLTQRVYQQEEKRTIKLTIQPIQAPDFPEGFRLVVFREMGETEQSNGEVISEEEPAGNKELVDRLEAELQQTREEIQVTVEEYETSNEELRASNEELQVTTEELETSKEELQSVNEELKTVNEELEYKLKELHQANDDLNNLMEATEIGIIFVDQNLHIKRYTSKIKGLFNLVSSDIDRPLSHITNTLAYPNFIKDVEKILEDHSPVKKLVSSIDDKWYIMRLRPYHTTPQGIGGAVITFMDITDLKQTEEALTYRAKQQEAIAYLWQYALDNFDLKLTMDKTVQVVSDVLETEYTALLEFDSSDNTLLLASGTGWPEGTVGERRLEVDNRLETGYTLEAEEPVIVDDFQTEGRMKPSPLLNEHEVVSSLSVKLKEEKGAFGILGVYTKQQRSFNDSEVLFLQKAANLLSEAVKRVQANNELEEANRKLQEAVKLRDEFLSIASHELQTPIASMKAYAEIFRHKLREIDNQNYVQQADKINERIDQLSALISRLLDLPRIQQGGLTLEKETFSMPRLIKEKVDTLQHVSHHTIKIEGEEVQDIYADRSRIGQVLTNLLQNAIKYSPEAKEVLVCYGEEDGNIFVSVKDYGVGIPESDREKVFYRFFKGDGNRNTYPGFGIGLYISSQIIEHHGGTIRLEDNEGEGSVFTFTLPIAENENT